MWTIAEGLQSVKQHKLINLIAIRTRGFENAPLTGIQLIFDDEISSPVFASTNQSIMDDFKTVSLPSGLVKEITSRCDTNHTDSLIF